MLTHKKKKLISSEAPVLTADQMFFDFLKPLENRQLKSQMFTFFCLSTYILKIKTATQKHKAQQIIHRLFCQKLTKNNQNDTMWKHSVL